MELRTTALLALALALLPSAANSQETQAPADAYLYFIWPQDGETIKGAFWARFGLRNMGVTQAGSTAPNTGHHHLLIDVRERLRWTDPILTERAPFLSVRG